MIFDCCYAANAARNTTDGSTKELLAACGRETSTYGVGIRSFTSALTEELQAFGRMPFTVAMLNGRLVTMRWRLAFTPIYAPLSEFGGSSITICPLPDVNAFGQSEQSDAVEIKPEDGECPSANFPPSLPSSEPEAPYMDTRVLLSVAIDQDAAHNVAEWVSWLTTAAPWDVSKVDVRVQNMVKNHSTLSLFTVPIHAWDRLPERAAYRFVG